MSSEETLSVSFPAHTVARKGSQTPSPGTVRSYSVHFMLFVRQEGNADEKDTGQGQGGHTR